MSSNPAAPLPIRFGGWATSGTSRPGVREILLDPRTRRWLVGAAIADALLVAGNLRSLDGGGLPVLPTVLIWVHQIIFMIAFMIGPPLSWPQREPVKVWIAVAFFLLSLPFLAYSGNVSSGVWFWVYVAVFIGVQTHERAYGLLLIGSLGAGALVIGLASGIPLGEGLGQPVTIASIGMMMGAFSRQLVTIRKLHATQNELAELAVAEERNRLARDMHDILGHSLTVIAVKAELAGRLMDEAPATAKEEIADLEDLARGALADVRATVSGYRGVNVLSELATARRALVAAGIEADLPSAADSIRAKDRELFGWVLREGITNVIRHSKAKKCSVTLGSSGLVIDDDGVGADGAPCGNGLHGLSERAEANGATLSSGASPLGGFQLRLTL